MHPHELRDVAASKAEQQIKSGYRASAAFSNTDEKGPMRDLNIRRFATVETLHRALGSCPSAVAAPTLMAGTMAGSISM